MFSKTIKTFYIKVTSGDFFIWKMCIKADLKCGVF